eukprot:3042057-Alexandrium_andersonii.AAC.1
MLGEGVLRGVARVGQRHLLAIVDQQVALGLDGAVKPAMGGVVLHLVHEVLDVLDEVGLLH